MDTNTNVPPGTTCGQDRVCNAGTCTDCTVGATCNVTGKPCRRGTTACNTGAPVCLEAGDQPNGSVCGTDLVCSGGRLRRVHRGTRVRPRQPVPRRRHRLLADDRLQRHRQQPGERHQLRHRPRVQRRSVRARAPRARPASRPTCARPARRRARPARRCASSRATGRTAPAAAPTWCAWAAAASTCSAGAACVPANPCHNGTLSCSTGAPVCTDSRHERRRRHRRAAPTWCAGPAAACRAPRVRPASRRTRARTA